MTKKKELLPLIVVIRLVLSIHDSFTNKKIELKLLQKYWLKEAVVSLLRPSISGDFYAIEHLILFFHVDLEPYDSAFIESLKTKDLTFDKEIKQLRESINISS